jgi:predicted RNase H-like HicB family nuclease
MSTTFAINRECEYQSGDTITFNPNSYRCHVALLREDDGTFSAIVLNLPGTGSCGDTEEEAIANAREAAAGVIESYIHDHESIPWVDETKYTFPEGAKQRWILVNV